MIKIGIQLQDTDFARALARGLAREGRNFSIALLERNDEKDFDLILSDEPSGANRIALTKVPEDEQIFDGPPYRIFRYKEAGTLISNLFFIYCQNTGRNPESTGDTACKTLVFTSLSGGPDGTALALVTAQLLYKHYGLRCLYLNLCPVDGSKRFLSGGNGRGLLPLLYYLDQEKDFPLQPFITRSLHVDLIDTSLINPYFDEMGAALSRRLLRKIDELGSYAYLILDMGNHLSRYNKELLKQAEQVILVADSREQLPAPFFSNTLEAIEQLAAGSRVKTVLLEDNPAEEREEMPLQEDGLLDLDGMKHLQWEAGRLVKAIMEYGEA